MRREQRNKGKNLAARTDSKISRGKEFCSRSRKLLAGHDGSALLAVTGIMLAAVALSLSLLLGAFSLSAMARRTSAKEQCRIMAESVGRQLDEELQNQYYPDIPLENPAGDRLWDYVGAYICEPDSRWADYDPKGTPGHSLSQARRIFRLEGEDWPDDAGEVVVGIYWIKEDQGGKRPEESQADYFRRTDIDLYVEITCTCQNESCTVTNVYAKVSNPTDHSWKWFRRVEEE